MAIWYTSKSGNDSNSGASYVLSKLTIQAGINVCAAGDTLVVGAGIYNEKTTRTSNNITILADGIVTIDGTGLVGNPLLSFSNTAAVTTMTITISISSTGGQWIFQNNSGNSIIYASGVSGNYAINLNVDHAIFLSAVNPFGINLYTTNTTVSSALVVTSCVFVGFSSYGVANNNAYSANSNDVYSLSVYLCTFYNCGTAIYCIKSTNGVTNLNVFQCVISNCTTAWNTNLAGGTISTYENLYYSITNWIAFGTTYTTLSQVQAAGYDTFSQVANPNFVDTTNNCFYLKQQQPLYPNVAQVGAYAYGNTMGSANTGSGLWNVTSSATNTGWWNPDGNITQNGTTNNLELTNNGWVFVVSGITTAPTAGATYTNNGNTYTIVSTNLYGVAPAIYGTLAMSGTNSPTATGSLSKSGGTGDSSITYTQAILGGQIWGPVIDSTIVGCKLSEFDVTGIQVYPTNMIDSDNTDVRPNYQTSEVRASDTLFNQNDGVVAWTVVKNNIPFTAVSGRYYQARITLRANAVQA